ncbi:uncharacterized protein L3040_008178 [Drepanopeziza brunnea f. sp. 'multigermtubi']|nr:hypothetical protein L3040_008178 [Drepanopeziza brunnea f. sp. 'multigermtubi']
MKFSIAILVSLVAAVAKADGNFHTVSFYTNQILSFSGNLTVPPRVPSGGVPYLWPGLQPPNNQGVLQPVLDGRNQHWYFGNAYVGNPSEPYGGGLSCSVGQNLGFHMNNIDGGGNWTIGVANGGEKVEYTFDIGLQMNQALFAVELYPGTNWDFGNLVFKHVVITAAGTDASWCSPTPLYSAVTLTIKGVRSSVSGNVVTCKIASLTIAPP